MQATRWWLILCLWASERRYKPWNSSHAYSLQSSAYLLGNFTWQGYSLVSKSMNHSLRPSFLLNSNGISIRANTAEPDCYFDHVGPSSFIFSRQQLNRFLSLMPSFISCSKRSVFFIFCCAPFSLVKTLPACCCAGDFQDVEEDGKKSKRHFWNAVNNRWLKLLLCEIIITNMLPCS